MDALIASRKAPRAAQMDSLRSKVFEDLYAKARELGGQVSGEHGIGVAKKPYLAESLSSEVRALMRGVKAAFDPKNILNPGKVVV